MLVYTRNGTEFVKSGRLKPGTKAVRVAIDGRASPSIWEAKRTLEIVSDAIRDGYAQANRYEIIEAKVNSLTLAIARRKTKLLKPGNKKSSIPGPPRADEVAQQSGPCRYSLLDALNHDLLKVREKEELRHWFENLFGAPRQQKTLGRQILERFWAEDR